DHGTADRNVYDNDGAGEPGPVLSWDLGRVLSSRGGHFGDLVSMGIDKGRTCSDAGDGKEADVRDDPLSPFGVRPDGHQQPIVMKLSTLEKDLPKPELKIGRRTSGSGGGGFPGQGGDDGSKNMGGGSPPADALEPEEQEADK